MKTLVIALFVLASMAFTEKTQENTTIKATFEGYEDGSYYFIDEDENSYDFQSVEKKAVEKYDLTDDDYKGKVFNVTYKMETKEEEEEESYIIYVIVDLEIVK